MDALTQALLDLGVGPGRPVAILSGNSIEHALMTLAAMQAGAPAAPVSPAYSLMSQDHVKLRYIFDLIRPGRGDGAGRRRPSPRRWPRWT